MDNKELNEIKEKSILEVTENNEKKQEEIKSIEENKNEGELNIFGVIEEKQENQDESIKEEARKLKEDKIKKSLAERRRMTSMMLIWSRLADVRLMRLYVSL